VRVELLEQGRGPFPALAGEIGLAQLLVHLAELRQHVGGEDVVGGPGHHGPLAAVDSDSVPSCNGWPKTTQQRCPRPTTSPPGSGPPPTQRSNRSRTNDRTGSADEKAWLKAFFDVRTEDLRNPKNAATQEEWAKSTDRVDCLRRVAAADGYRLDGPLTVTAFGTTYTLN
jgi:hypothetical protein